MNDSISRLDKSALLARILPDIEQSPLIRVRWPVRLGSKVAHEADQAVLIPRVAEVAAHETKNGGRVEETPHVAARVGYQADCAGMGCDLGLVGRR